MSWAVLAEGRQSHETDLGSVLIILATSMYENTGELIDLETNTLY